MHGHDSIRNSQITARTGRRESRGHRGWFATWGGLQLVEQNEARAAVEAQLAKLPGDQREALDLRLLAERSYSEIAEITGKKIGTVGWLISEGLKALSLNTRGLVPRVSISAAASRWPLRPESDCRREPPSPERGGRDSSLILCPPWNRDRVGYSPPSWLD